MQHQTSCTVNAHIREGYRITREYSNGEIGDDNISACELKKRGYPVLAFFVSNGGADRLPTFEDAVAAVEAETSAREA